jgi:hypothetical protein
MDGPKPQGAVAMVQSKLKELGISRINIRHYTLVLLVCTSVSGCATFTEPPRRGAIHYGESESEVDKTINQGDYSLVVIQTDKAIYRFDKHWFVFAPNAYWFEYKDDKLTSVFEQSTVPQAIQGLPCTPEAQQQLLTLADRARLDVTTFDFNDPGNTTAAEKDELQKAKVVMYVIVPIGAVMTVALAPILFPLDYAIHAPDISRDHKLNAYLAHTEFGSDETTVEGHLGLVHDPKDQSQKDRCVTDRYFGAGEMVTFAYYDGRLFAVNRTPWH